jgi:hypothetical protein
MLWPWLARIMNSDGSPESDGVEESMGRMAKRCFALSFTACVISSHVVPNDLIRGFLSYDTSEPHGAKWGGQVITTSATLA